MGASAQQLLPTPKGFPRKEGSHGESIRHTSSSMRSFLGKTFDRLRGFSVTRERPQKKKPRARAAGSLARPAFAPRDGSPESRLTNRKATKGKEGDVEEGRLLYVFEDGELFSLPLNSNTISRFLVTRTPFWRSLPEALRALIERARRIEEKARADRITLENYLAQLGGEKEPAEAGK